MKQNQKRALYESIMKNVGRNVKQVLNESEYGMMESHETFYESTVLHNVKQVVIGDPCYMMSRDAYDRIWGRFDYANGTLFDGHNAIGIVHTTAYGDGEYSGDGEFVYGVDAGALCIMDAKYADGDSLEYCNVIDVNENICKLGLRYSDGEFIFEINDEEIERVETACDEDEDEDNYENNDEDYADEDDYVDEDDYEDNDGYLYENTHSVKHIHMKRNACRGDYKKARMLAESYLRMDNAKKHKRIGYFKK